MNILTKYSLFMLGMLALAVGSMTGLAQQLQKQSLTHEAILRGQSIAVNLALSSGDDLLSKLYFRVVPLALRAKEDNDLVYAAVVNQENRVVGHADSSQINKKFKLHAVKGVQADDIKANVVEAMAGQVRVWDISVPVKPRGANRTIGLVHIGLAISKVEEAVAQGRNELLRASALLFVVGLLLTWAAVRIFVKPLEEMAQASAEVGAGNLEVAVPVRSKDELGQMATNFNAMVSNLKEAEKEKLEKERIQSELNLARSIQADLLPKQPPGRSDVDMAFFCEPAKELGGDFYDWFEVENGKKLAFVIADVSGKGVPAALHMTNLRNLFRFVSAVEKSPSEVLKKVNRLAYPDLRGESFVTLIYAVYDPAQSEICMANAGHDPAYLRHVKNGEIIAFNSTSLPVGLVDSDDFDPEVEEIKIPISDGDLFFIFTDGVTEAMNSADEQFGLDRLQQSLAQTADAAAVVKNVTKAVSQHAAGFEQSDDLTLLAFLKGRPGRSGMNVGSSKFVFSGKFDEEEVERMREAVSKALQNSKVDSEYVYTLVTVVDELASNMMEHSSANWIEMEILPVNGRIEVILRDNGELFDPTRLRDVDYEAYLKTGSERKLGLYMVRELTESFQYERHGSDMNEVTFEINLNSGETS